MSDALVTAEIQQSEIERMTRIVNAVVAKLDKQAENIIRQGMIWAVQSAARETAPGRAASPSKLADKFKYRPITRYRGSLNRYAYEVNGKTAKSNCGARRRTRWSKSRIPARRPPANTTKPAGSGGFRTPEPGRRAG